MLLSRFPLSAEQDVLHQLNAPDFRHVSKDKIMAFVSTRQQMDSATAQKALEQVPELAQATATILHDYDEVVKDGLGSNTAAVQAYFTTSASQTEALQRRLDSPDASLEERKLIIEEMRHIREQDAQMVTQNQKFIEKSHVVVATVTVLCVGIVASILGVNTSIQLTKPKA